MGREGLVLKGKGVVEGRVLGEALVSTMPISFLGSVDPETGVVVEKGHDLEGECLAGKILCFPHGKGSTVGSYVLLALKKKGQAPLALVNEVADPIVVVGAVVADIPMVIGINLEPLRTGDILEVDGSEGLVRVIKACS